MRGSTLGCDGLLRPCQLTAASAGACPMAQADALGPEPLTVRMAARYTFSLSAPFKPAPAAPSQRRLHARPLRSRPHLRAPRCLAREVAAVNLKPSSA
jgi:hypothetical protein